ncbi:UNKNOWN [Stylonychia lemnae]|uniref:Arrestin-like N-terminal domain-containing protein n=1 Tax=Stylonychia lemnae TaxID=5949 RepID=A0A078A3Z8_STYLE|nr:UNKNOWN [Stylonychia lemnae]|eukprot:CDW76248.1 UNKNOWN [Stylonychia lemnae]
MEGVFKPWLSIELAKSTYAPGESIEGIIYLLVKEEVPLGSVLSLQFLGKEKTQWSTLNELPGSDDRISHSGKQEIINLQAIIYQFKEQIPSSTIIQIPFKIPLDISLPSSLSYFSGSCDLAQVKYILRARLDDIFTQADSGFQSQKLKRVVFIQQKSLIDSAQSQISIARKIKNLLVFNKGQTNIDIYLSKDSYESNDIAQIMMKIDNQNCQKDLKSIVVELYREVLLQQTNTDDQNLIFRESQVLMRNKFVGIKKGEQEFNQFDIKLLDITVDQNNNKQSYMKMMKSLQKKQNNDELLMLENLIPSSKGHIIEVNYNLKFKFKHQGIIIGTEIPQVKLPIWIQCPQIDFSHHKLPFRLADYNILQQDIQVLENSMTRGSCFTILDNMQQDKIRHQSQYFMLPQRIHDDQNQDIAQNKEEFNDHQVEEFKFDQIIVQEDYV